MNRLFKTFLAAFALAPAYVASAMTFSELQSAVDAAEPGDTVYVTSDMTFDGPLAVAKKVTIASGEGDGPFVLRPAETYASGTFLTLDSAAADADITFTNLVFDGQRGTTNYNTRELFILSAGKVTLESGAVIRNRYCPSYPAVQVSSKGSFVMEEGSEIRGIVCNNYGIAVKTGAAGSSAADGTFTMNGGLITECAGHHQKTDAPALWDGVIYLYGGTFYAHGGTICGNTSDYSTAGVCNYFGKMFVSGSFTATNNIGGAANDVCRCRKAGDNNAIQIDGDYTGHMTIKLIGEDENPIVEGGAVRFVYTSTAWQSRLGCENIVSEDDPAFAMDLSATQIVGGWYPKWRRIAAKIAGKTNKFKYSEAFDAAVSGDTILLCQDISFAKHTWIDRDLTFASDVGGPYVIRKTGSGYAFAIATNATVTFRDVILDGNGLTNTYNRGMVEAHRNGTIVLDAGAVIRGAVCPNSASAVLVYNQPGARLVIKDGALITDCTNSKTGSYGAAVCIGNGEPAPDDLATNPPVIEMRGGTITRCTCPGTSLPGSGYSGIVYLWSTLGTFEMSGGAITGNVGVCAGVVGYQGTMRFSGNAVVKGGEGDYPGIFICGSNKAYFSGDFRGWIDVANGSSGSTDDQTAGKAFKVSPADASATGAWCFHASRSATDLVGKVADGSVVWAEPIGSVGGVKAATADDLQLLLPTAFDLNVGSADYEKLPVVLTGAATGLGANVALAFDKDMRKRQPAWSQPLIAAGAGETLTGAWIFSLPVGSEKNWSVAATDAAYSLAYYPSGSVFVIR